MLRCQRLAALAIAVAGLSQPGVADSPNQRQEANHPASILAGNSGGSEFLSTTQGLAGPVREQAIRNALLMGHFPDSLLDFEPVELANQHHKITIFVSPDYLGIGTEDDFVRMPMSLDTARIIAQYYDCILPTVTMVDAIYQQADRHIEAHYLPPGRQMTSNDYYAQHNQWINDQLFAPIVADRLVAGHKKDLVLTQRLMQRPDRVAIYGWPRLRDRSPTQPLSLWHGRPYVDYSHGTRLVSRYAVVDGKTQDLYQVMQDPELAPLLSSEGPLNLARLMNATPSWGYVTGH
jgi:hypothetical protein